MAARPGSENPLSGPRLPHSKNPPRQKVVQGIAPLTPEPDELGDPAKGARVERCLTCGIPGELVTGTFSPDRGGRFAGRHFRYRLCVRCIERANGPLDPDPLHVEAA